MSVELVKSQFIAEKAVPKKLELKDENEFLVASSQQDIFQSKLDIVRGVGSNDERDGDSSQSQEGNTNAVGSTAVPELDSETEAISNLEAGIAGKPLLINNESIDSLKDMYPNNSGVKDLQDSLRGVLDSGKDIDDLPDEMKAQLKLIFNPK